MSHAVERRQKYPYGGRTVVDIVSSEQLKDHIADGDIEVTHEIEWAKDEDGIARPCRTKRYVWTDK